MPRVLDVDDCPVHDIVHDICLFPKYYDPIYHPCCHLQIFESPMAVREWIENALNSHVTVCSACLQKKMNSSVRYSVQWRESQAGFLVCVILNGRFKQCIVHVTDIQSAKYTHCWVLSRLYEKCLSPKLRVTFTAPPVEATNVFNSVANKVPAWLHYSEALYHLHLSYLSLPILSGTVKKLQQANWQILRNKQRCVSKIVDHFILERNTHYSTCTHRVSTTLRDNICSFVDCMEVLYGKDVAALLRETPFSISAQANRNLNFSCNSELSWFNESVENLARRLRSFTMQCIVSHIEKIPGHRRPTSNSSGSHQKILNCLVDHILRRVSYLFTLKMASICEIVLL